MIRFTGPGAALLMTCVTAVAQDVPGIEICTRQSRMEARTGCLQSNIEFLQQLVGKTAREAQQKLGEANREIATLKEALAGLQARIDQLEKAKPDVKPDAKPEVRPDSKGEPKPVAK